MSFDRLPSQVIIHCILPYLPDREKKILSILCKRFYALIHRFCLLNDESVDDLCRRGEWMILRKRKCRILRGSHLRSICEGGDYELVKQVIEGMNPRKLAQGLRGSYYKGHLRIIELLYAKGAQKSYHISYEACRGGRREIVDQIIKEKYCLSAGLKGACCGGSLDIIKLLLNQIKYIDALDNTVFFESACFGNHLHVIKFLLKVTYIHSIDWERVINSACLSGNIDIVKLISERVHNEDWKDGFKSACLSGNEDVFKYVIEKTNGILHWDDGLDGACIGGHMTIVKYIVEKREIKDWVRHLASACRGGRREIIDLMLEKINTNFNWSDGLCSAVLGGHKVVIDFIISSPNFNANDIYWNMILISICRKGNNEIINLVMSYIEKTNYSIDWNEILGEACTFDHWDFIDLANKKGAKYCYGCGESASEH